MTSAPPIMWVPLRRSFLHPGLVLSVRDVVAEKAYEVRRVIRPSTRSIELGMKLPELVALLYAQGFGRAQWQDRAREAFMLVTRERKSDD